MENKAILPEEKEEAVTGGVVIEDAKLPTVDVVSTSGSLRVRPGDPELHIARPAWHLPGATRWDPNGSSGESEAANWWTRLLRTLGLR